MNACQTLFLERVTNQIVQWIKGNLVPLMSALIIGATSHFYAFTNKIISFDDLTHMFNKGWSASSGRWGLDLISFVLPDVSIPWFYGLISLVLFSVAACLMVEMFQFRSKLIQALLTGSIMAFPSLTATVVFLYTLAPYGVSFLLATVAVILMNKSGWGKFLLATVLMIFSLGIYQAYISLAASLLVLLLIQKLLQGENVIQVIRKGVCFLAFLIVSLGAYYLITMGINKLMDVELNVYAQNRICFSVSYIPTGIIEAYRAFINFFTVGLCSLAPTAASRWIHILCCLCTAGLLGGVVCAKLKKELLRAGLLLVLVVMLPIAINAMYLFVVAWQQAIHCLVLYSYVVLYLFAAVVVEECWKSETVARLQTWCFQIGANAIVLGLTVVIAINIYVANATYFKLFMQYESTYAFYTSLMADLREHPEFTPETPVAICGDYPEPYIYEDHFPFTYTMFGASGLHPGYGFAYNFSHYYLGLRHDHIPNFVDDDDQIHDIMETEVYSTMECYPYYGCIQTIGDTLVVKLS